MYIWSCIHIFTYPYIFNPIQIGSKVTSLKLNDHVIPSQAGLGTWRSSAVASAASFMKIPTDFPLDQAATIATIPCTAYRLLSNDFVTLAPGDTIIQNGANSAVGKCVIQLAKARGLRTINVIGSDVPDFESVSEQLKGLGADLVVLDSYVDTPAYHRLTSDFPKPTLGLNCIGGKVATNVARVVAKGGTFVTYGGMYVFMVLYLIFMVSNVYIYSDIHIYVYS